jgi:hypothetical protein
MASMQLDRDGWAWGHSEYSSVAVGETGPWVSWLPLAWRAVTDPLGEHALPPPPRHVRPWDADSRDYASAWWGPLLQLLFFAKGWARPDLGLARWLDLGQPDDDPVLKIVNRWWGPRAVEVLAWSSWSHTLTRMAEQISEATHTAIQDVLLPDRWAEVRRSDEWETAWGCGSDCMHLSTHAVTPVWDVPDGGDAELIASRAGGAPRAVLALPSYAGWYATLSRLGSRLPPRSDGRSWRIDVVVRPLGYLGTYRRSRETGRWFTGQHRWHELGLDTPLPE